MSNSRCNLFFAILAFILLIENVTPSALRATGSKSPRIIGGSPAFAGQFPFAAGITAQTSNSQFFCGGTLTANQWVLTAGHCVYNAVQFSITLRSNHLQSNDPERLTVASSSYIIHPEFDPLTIENDLGLIKLRFEVVYDEYLHSIHPLDTENWTSDNAYVQGWGSTSDEDGELTDELRYVIIEALTNEECRLYYGSQITDNMMCLIGNFNEGTCIGDNGGAAVVQRGRTFGIVGIASFVSANGCESPYPSGFTKTYPYYDWITGITGETD